MRSFTFFDKKLRQIDRCIRQNPFMIFEKALVRFSRKTLVALSYALMDSIWSWCLAVINTKCFTRFYAACMNAFLVKRKKLLTKNKRLYPFTSVSAFSCIIIIVFMSGLIGEFSRSFRNTIFSVKVTWQSTGNSQ